MKEQIIELEELGIPSIVLSTKDDDVLLLRSEIQVFCRCSGRLLDGKFRPKLVEDQRFSATQLCHA